MKSCQRGMLVAAVAALMVVSVGPLGLAASPPKVVRYLDKATSCRRVQDHECTLKQADKALKWLSQREDSRTAMASFVREALTFRAEALAELSRPEAASAFDTLLNHSPAYRPLVSSEAVKHAFDAARVRRVKAKLPKHIGPGQPPAPPMPKVVDMVPPPVIYRTRRLLELDPNTDARKAFRLSLGVGGALMAGESTEFFEQGLAAVFELAYVFENAWRISLQLNMSLHGLAEGVRADGFGGLTTVAVTVGAGYDLELIEDLEMVFGAAVGAGFFGARSATDEVGLSGQLVVGVRYWISPNLSLRVDATPQLIVPIGGRVDAAAHVNVFARAEAKF